MRVSRGLTFTICSAHGNSADFAWHVPVSPATRRQQKVDRSLCASFRWVGGLGEEFAGRCMQAGNGFCLCSQMHPLTYDVLSSLEARCSLEQLHPVLGPGWAAPCQRETPLPEVDQCRASQADGAGFCSGLRLSQLLSRIFHMFLPLASLIFRLSCDCSPRFALAFAGPEAMEILRSGVHPELQDGPRNIVLV